MNKTIQRKIDIPKSKLVAAEAIVKHLATLIATADKEHLESIARSLEPVNITEAEEDLAKDIAGSDYTSEKMWHLELANLQKYYQRRHSLLKGAISASEVAELLGFQSRQTPHDRVKNNRLLAIKDNGVYKFPLSQFDPEGADGLINGLPEVLVALEDVSPFTRLNWLSKPNSVFDGLTPLEMLKQGEIDQVVVEARALGFC